MKTIPAIGRTLTAASLVAAGVALADSHAPDPDADERSGSLTHTAAHLPQGLWTARPHEIAHHADALDAPDTRVVRNGACESRFRHEPGYPGTSPRDPDEDRPAHALVSCNGKPVLYARGYSLSPFTWAASGWTHAPDTPAHAALEHWPGTHGCTVTRLTAYADGRVARSVRSTTYRIDSLRGGRMCVPPQTKEPPP